MEMTIEWILVVLGIVTCAYSVGYLSGYRHCFEYLRAELKKAKEDEYKNDKM